MRARARRSVVAAAAVIASAAFAPSLAQAHALSHLQDRADAWKQVEPLLRERSRAKAGGFDFEPSFEIERGDGYVVVVKAVGSSIAVVVGKGNRAITAYLARGTATSRRLKASFGPFGKVDMRFHPAAKPPPPEQGCYPHRRFGRRLGTWVGGFRFVGEGAYISIDARRAGGGIRRRRPTCPHLPVSVHRKPQATSSGNPFSSFSLLQLFSAGWHHGLESAQLYGLQIRERTLFFANTQQSLGGVGIVRLATAAGKLDTFTVDGALTHAEASPPRPFHGTGIYTAAPDGIKSWLGDLTVHFPGMPRYPLTGEQFEVRVKRPL